MALCPPVPVANPVVTISKEIKFSSAHELPHHQGKCKNRHGHTYVLQVKIRGFVRPVDGQSESGMVFDFSRLGRTLKRLHDECLDHKNLNDFDEYPTAERMVLRIAYLLLLDLGPDLHPFGASIASVRLYEESVFPACYAEIENPNLRMLGDALPDTKLCRRAEWTSVPLLGSRVNG